MEIQEGNIGSAATAATVPVVEPKPKRLRGALNKKHLQKLSTAESVAAAAQSETYAASIGNREITKEFVDQFVANITSARDKAAEALRFETASSSATAEHAKAEKALHAALKEVQKAAKQKYARTNRVALRNYFVGDKLNGSVPNLAQTSQTILKKLAVDQLPGFTPEKVKAIDAARTGWFQAKAAQATNLAFAQEARADFKALLQQVDDARITIQLAADAEWPHTDEANAGIRKEFGLSSKRAMNV
jgi:hypothetical protein